jgi:hypothetical protein
MHRWLSEIAYSLGYWWLRLARRRDWQTVALTLILLALAAAILWFGRHG